MIVKTHPLPVKRQAELLEISRSNVYYLAAPTSEKDLGADARDRRGTWNTPFSARGSYPESSLARGIPMPAAYTLAR